jgi:DNA-directed RNA polymerase specialized sigma24 family protein
VLFTVAYEMLGSAAGAENVPQESWPRWADVDRPQARDPRAYLVRVVTRQALNRLRVLSCRAALRAGADAQRVLALKSAGTGQARQGAERVGEPEHDSCR